MIQKRLTGIVLVLVFLAACASAGKADKILVRAQDVQANSLAVFEAAMTWHYAHSREESREVYAALEKVRTGFPKAWAALSSAVRIYKQAKLGDLTPAIADILELLKLIPLEALR